MVNLAIPKQLSVKLPNVYRYIEKKWVDLFFDTGKLRLSSFSKFREYPDEIRGDKSEGNGAMMGQSDDEKRQFVIITQVGNDAYVLCTSTIESEEPLKEFGYDSYFRIKNPLGFAIAISNSILGFSSTFQGLCNYQSHREIAKTISGLSIDDFKNDEGKFVIGAPKMRQRMNEIVEDGSDLMFLKLKNYQKQMEYRFIWKINSNFFESQPFLDIECKEAIQFCERPKP